MCVCVSERERETERDRERQRETETETDRQTDRQTDRDREKLLYIYSGQLKSEYFPSEAALLYYTRL